MKQERPTPETDAWVYEWSLLDVDGIDDDHPPYIQEFARKLERERDEARELARELRDVLKMLHDVTNEHVRDAVVVVPLGYANAALTKAEEVLP